MQRLAFHQLPLVVQIATGVAFYTSWWCLEEFVINRVGLWRYMPGYQVASGCLWDLAVGLIIAVPIWRASRRGGTQTA